MTHPGRAALRREDARWPCGIPLRMQQRCSKRCTECRARFVPARSAEKTQKVCSLKCRQRRRRRLARKRRAQRIQDYRVDERVRQQRHRERRRSTEAASTATGPPPCHAPASACNSADFAAKVLESWDRAVAMSRASLERRMPGILRDLVAFSGRAKTAPSELSRASLAPEVPEMP